MSEREAEDNQQEPIDPLPEELFTSVNEFTKLDGMQTFIGMQADQITAYKNQIEDIIKVVFDDKLSDEEKVAIAKVELSKNDRERVSASKLVQEEQKETFRNLLRTKSEDIAALEERIEEMKREYDNLNEQLTAKKVM